MAAEHDVVAEWVGAHSWMAIALYVPVIVIGMGLWYQWARKHENDVML